MAKNNSFRAPPSKKGKRFQVKDAKPAIDYDSEKLAFSLRHMKYKGPCCISKCQSDKKALILNTLLRLSQFTWKDMRSIPREKGLEKISLDRFSVPFPPVITPEITLLVARYDNDGGRIAGFRVEDTFHIVLAGKKLYPH
jgi:hypothetical protein